MLLRERYYPVSAEAKIPPVTLYFCTTLQEPVARGSTERSRGGGGGYTSKPTKTGSKISIISSAIYWRPTPSWPSPRSCDEFDQVQRLRLFNSFCLVATSHKPGNSSLLYPFTNMFVVCFITPDGVRLWEGAAATIRQARLFGEIMQKV